MLFLGAGASKPFDIGDLSDLTKGVNKIFRNAGYSDLLEHINNTFQLDNDYSTYFLNNGSVDMEVLLSVLDFLVDPQQKIQTLGPTIAYLSTPIKKYSGKVPSKQQLIQLKIKIEKHIVNSCSKCNFEKAHEYYRRLFELEKSLALDFVNGANRRPTSVQTFLATRF
jgi:hypothetical protein